MPGNNDRFSGFLIFNTATTFILLILLPLGGAIWSLLGLFFLGIIQFIATLLATLRGSRIMGYYLLASILFLLIYFATISGYFGWLNQAFGGIPEEYLLTIPPLGMSVIFIVLWGMRTNEVAKPNLNPNDDLLDDGF